MKGIIYKITCNESGEVYYGSTTQTLNKRMIGHKASCKQWKEGKHYYTASFSIIERGNYSYSLIENVECEDKKQLEARERFYIENNQCINNYIPNRTRKEYYEDNKEYFKKKFKEYREANKEKIKGYYQAKKEKIKEYYQAKKAAKYPEHDIKDGIVCVNVGPPQKAGHYEGDGVVCVVGPPQKAGHYEGDGVVGVKND